MKAAAFLMKRMYQTELNWYLVQTKAGKERWVHDQVCGVIRSVFLPLLKVRLPRWGRPIWSIVPMFPGYLFAQLDLHTQYFQIKYMSGVHGLVSAGNEPLTVAGTIIDTIKQRCVDGVVQMPESPLYKGARVTVAEGPFRGVEAIFKHYLSGEERVAILLGSIQNGGPRLTLPRSAVLRLD